MKKFNWENYGLPDPKWFLPVVIVFTLVFVSVICSVSWGAGFTASYYTVESCLREGTSGIMANGKRLDDARYTAASWDYPFGTRLRVTNTRNGKSVVVSVEDRGPAKRLYRKGRVIDLSKAAFERIGALSAGIVPVKIERIN